MRGEYEELIRDRLRPKRIQDLMLTGLDKSEFSFPHPSVKISALVGLLGVSYLGATTLILHFQTAYDPLRNAVSDYAIGQYATEMTLGFFVGGTGVVALALAILFSQNGRTLKIGSSLLLAAGFTLFTLGAFPTDLQGAAATVHGTVHASLSAVVFTSGPVGMLLVSQGYGRKWLLPTIFAFVASSAFAIIVQLLFGFRVSQSAASSSSFSSGGLQLQYMYSEVRPLAQLRDLSTLPIRYYRT